MKKLIPKGEAKAMLSYLEEKIVDAYYDALEATNKQAKYAIGIPNKSSTAFNMNSNVINAFKSKVADMDDVVIVPQHNTFVFLIKDTIAAKFKKHNKKGLSSNIYTKNTGYLQGQQLHLAFPGMSLISYLEFAYRTNTTYTEFEFIRIVCTYNKQVIWGIDLEIRNSGEGTTEIIPIAPVRPNTGSGSEKRFTINKQKDKAVNDED